MGHQCQRKNLKMSTAQNLIIRASIVLGMAAAVVTILYLTPLPDQHFKNCDRPCHHLDWPMICRVTLNLEVYQTMSGVCKDCPSNTTDCTNKFCSSADGNARGIISANRQLPGPSIQVCQNDILVIDVVNKMPGHNVAIHWRGQPNNEAPSMDGVPMVTQCPITSFTTFQYLFRASSPGTHFYHAHSDNDRTDGLFGALIVRQPDKTEPHRKLYDVDDKEHVLLITEWSGDLSAHPDILNNNDDKPKALLINGKTHSGTSLTEYKVKRGKRYRFRVAYTSGAVGCPVNVLIDDHLMKVIALDGNPVKPYEVSYVTLSKGERFDFVLKTTEDIGSFLIRVKSNCNDNPLEGLAVIKYEGSRKQGSSSKTVKKADVYDRNLDTSVCSGEIGKVCLGDIRSLSKLPEELKEPEVERKIYLGFDYKITEKEGKTGGYSGLRSKIYRINNFTFTYPSSPLLTQPDDVPQTMLCSETSVPEKCKDKNICECVHIEHIPLGATTELILIDQGGDELEHIFHMHGYHFYVVGANIFDRSLSMENIQKLDSQEKLIRRNFASPVLKDTIRVPKYGVVAVRFLANNSGFWMLRDEQSKGWTRGLDVLFQVGDYSDMMSPPNNFPTCGSYIGPEFYLL